MADYLVGAGKTYTTLEAALTAVGNFGGTGANRVIIDEGYQITLDLKTNDYLTNTDPNDTLVITSASGKFLYTPVGVATESIILDTVGVIMEKFSATSNFSSTLGIMYKAGNSFREFDFVSTGPACNAIYGSTSETSQVVEDANISGVITQCVRFVNTVKRVSTFNPAYGINGAINVIDCAVFGAQFSDDIISGPTVTTCATSDASGSVGFINLTATDHFVDAAGGDYTLKGGSSLIGAGTSVYSIGADQLTGFVVSPIINNLSVDTFTTSGATLHVTNNVADGNLYIVVSDVATVPSKVQMAALQQASGAAGIFTQNFVLSNAMQQNLAMTGLSLFTEYYVHVMHTRASSQTSDILTSAKFVTSDIPRPEITSITRFSPDIPVTITGTGYGTVTGKININGVDMPTPSAWSATSITYLNAIGASAYGDVTLKIIDSGAVESRDEIVNLIPIDSLRYVNILSPSTATSALNVGSTPLSLNGDQFEYDKVTTLGNEVVINPTSTFSIYGGGKSRQEFKVRRWTKSLNEWTPKVTEIVNPNPAANTLPIILPQSVSVQQGDNLVITLGDLLDGEGEKVTYSITGTTDYIAGPALNQITFNSVADTDQTFTAYATDGTDTVNAQISVTVTTAPADNVLPILNDQTINGKEGEVISITLGDVNDPEGQLITYTTPSGTGASSYTSTSSNAGTWTNANAGTYLITVHGVDTVGGFDDAVITIIITVQVEISSIDTIGRSLVVNTNNGSVGMSPHGTSTGSITNLIDSMALADGLIYDIGRHQITPGNAILTTLGDQEVLDFIAASTADAIMVVGRTEAVGQQTPDWLTAAGTAADAIKLVSADIIWYQGWLKQDNWNNTTAGYVIANWKAVQAANGGTIIQTFEALDYMRTHPDYGPTYFAPIGVGYDITAPDILWADNTHGNIAMYYIAAGCLYRAMTGKLTSDAAYIFQTDFNMPAAFIKACNECIDAIQVEVMPGITLVPYVAGTTEYWASADVQGASVSPNGETVNFLNLGENSGVNTDPFSRNLLTSTGEASNVMFNVPSPANWAGRGGTPIRNSNANWVANNGFLPDVLMRELDSTFQVPNQARSFSGLTPNQEYTLQYSGCRDGSTKQRTVSITFGSTTEIFEASYNNGVDKVNTSSGVTLTARADGSGIIPLVINEPTAGEGGGDYLHFSGFILSKGNAPSNLLPILLPQSVEVFEGEDLVITLGDAKDQQGQDVTYSVVGTTSTVGGPLSTQITFNSIDVKTHTFTAKATDGIDEVTATITVLVKAQLLTQVTANVVQNVSKDVTLGPVQNEAMQTLTYSINPADYTIVGNVVTIVSATGGGVNYQILTDDGQGGGPKVTGQLTVNTQATQDEIVKIDMLGWSLVDNSNNGDASLTPYGTKTGSVPQLVEQMATADGILHTLGEFINPGAATMTELGKQVNLDFIAATTAQAVLISGHSQSSAMVTPDWTTEAAAAANAVIAKGKQIMWYQGWLWQNNTNPTTVAQVVTNFENLKTAHGGTIVRTMEAIEYMRLNYAEYFTPIGTGYNNQPATQLFADDVHGTFAMYYITAACVYRAMSGRLTSNRAYTFPTLFSGINPAFLAACNEAVDKAQTEALTGITIQLYGTDYSEIWASAGTTQGILAPAGQVVNYLDLGDTGGGLGKTIPLNKVGGSASGVSLVTDGGMFGGSTAVAAKVGDNTGYLPDVLMGFVDFDNGLPYTSKFTGLTPDIAYTLKLTGSRTGSPTRIVKVQLGGAGNVAEFEATENRNLGITLTATADAQGELVFNFITPDAGGNGWSYMTGFILTSGTKNTKYLADIETTTLGVL